MQKTQEQTSSRSAEKLYKFFIYFVLVMLAVTIIVPVAWVFMASIKQNSEFYGNPWALPAGFYWQNFVDAWNGAKMGQYMLNSVAVTALALVLLLVIALPAAYCLSRFKFRGSKLLNTLFMAGLFINVNYIVVPIFLMLRDGDTWLKNVLGSSFLLNNLVVLAVVYASTALPFTIYLLSGKAFEASILPMQLIMPTLVLIGLTNIMGIQILVPTGREKQVLFSEIVGAVVNVVVNSLLIPQMGAAGAAIGTVLAELAVLVVQIVALGREILPALAVLPYLKTGVALAAAVASVWWLLGSSLHPFVVLAASAVLFFAAYGVLLLLMGERMVREIWSQVWEKTVGKVLKK